MREGAVVVGLFDVEAQGAAVRCRSLLPESSRGASYPVPVFEFLNVNELSMKQMTFEGK